MNRTDAESAGARSHGHPRPIENIDQISSVALVTRSTFGGLLMGLANLVPGVSGGTMLLAAGIYPRFIGAVAEVTRFRFCYRSFLVLGCVVGAAGLGILLLAGTLKDLVVEQRWIMYSLFIGLTLGGIPVVWRMARRGSTGLVVSALISFLAMVVLAILQAIGVVGESSSNLFTLFFAGLAGASAMILPGVSGGYLLLLLGQYVPVLSAIDQFKDALRAQDLAAATEPALSVLLPVGLGVLAGVAVVGNLLQWLLTKYRKPTLGALLGLLIGSIAGLWPFQAAVQPKVGDVVKGQVVTASSLPEIDAEDWPTEFFRPQSGQIALGILLIVTGFGLTISITKVGGEKNS